MELLDVGIGSGYGIVVVYSFGVVNRYQSACLALYTMQNEVINN